MPQNPAYLDAEAGVYRRYGLTPTVRPLALTQPPLRLRVAEIGRGEPVLFLHGFNLCVAQCPWLDDPAACASRMAALYAS